MLDMALVKTGSLTGKGVDLRGDVQRMPVAAQTRRPQFIRHEEDEIHLG